MMCWMCSSRCTAGKAHSGHSQDCTKARMAAASARPLGCLAPLGKKAYHMVMETLYKLLIHSRFGL